MTQKVYDALGRELKLVYGVTRGGRSLFCFVDPDTAAVVSIDNTDKTAFDAFHAGLAAAEEAARLALLKLDLEVMKSRTLTRRMYANAFSTAQITAILSEYEGNYHKSPSDQYQTPWFKVFTHYGMFTIGLRRHVFEVSWKDTNIQVPASAVEALNSLKGVFIESARIVHVTDSAALPNLLRFLKQYGTPEED